jgi:hypothetical protein
MLHWKAEEIIFNHTQDGLTWQAQTFAQPGCIAIVKRGKHGTLLDSRCEFDGTSWVRQPSSKVPKYLVKRLEELVRERLALVKPNTRRVQP